MYSYSQKIADIITDHTKDVVIIEPPCQQLYRRQNFRQWTKIGCMVYCCANPIIEIFPNRNCISIKIPLFI